MRRGRGRTEARAHGGTGARLRVRAAVAILVSALVAGCELEELTVPLGREMIAVHGMLSLAPDAVMQYVIVERTITGTGELPETDSLRGIPRPPLPVSGATVVVTRDDGLALRYSETATPGIYGLALDPAVSFLSPGREYRLRVDLPDGRQVLGRTTMPAPPVVTGLPDAGATFDRDRDTLRLSWTAAEGFDWVFVQVRPRDLERRTTLGLLTDSSSVTIPGRLPAVWVAGTRQTLAVSAIDRNYFDQLRTGNDDFTAGGYLNHLEGGIGVFGSVAPIIRTVVVRAAVDHPYEGRYALRMLVGADSLVGEMELYVTRDLAEPLYVSAIVTGVTGPASASPVTPLAEAEASGEVGGGQISMRIVENGTWRRGTIEGAFEPAGTSTGVVRAADGRVTGGFTLTRLP